MKNWRTKAKTLHPDFLGRLLAVGDRVMRVAAGPGNTTWATSGTVVGFARRHVWVRWDGYGYSTPRAAHAANGFGLRKVDER